MSAWRSVVLVIAVVFYFANVPDIKMEDEYHLDDPTAGRDALHLVAPAFRAGGGGAVFLRGGAGRDLQLLHQLHDRGDARAFPAAWNSGWSAGWFETGKTGALAFSRKGAANLARSAFVCFLRGPLQRLGAAEEVLGAQGAGTVWRAERAWSACWSS